MADEPAVFVVGHAAVEIGVVREGDDDRVLTPSLTVLIEAPILDHIAVLGGEAGDGRGDRAGECRVPHPHRTALLHLRRRQVFDVVARKVARAAHAELRPIPAGGRHRRVRRVRPSVLAVGRADAARANVHRPGRRRHLHRRPGAFFRRRRFRRRHSSWLGRSGGRRRHCRGAAKEAVRERRRRRIYAAAVSSHLQRAAEAGGEGDHDDGAEAEEELIICGILRGRRVGR